MHVELISTITKTFNFYLAFTSLAESLIIRFALDHLINGEIWAITITTILTILILFWTFLIFLQPMRKNNPYCSTILVPLLPCVSIFFDIFFMVWLSPYAWIRFLVWSFLGRRNALRLSIVLKHNKKTFALQEDLCNGFVFKNIESKNRKLNDQ